MLKVIDNAIGEYDLRRTIQQLRYYQPTMDLYDNPFESKLQLPKELHKEFPFLVVLDQLLNNTTIAMMEVLFDTPLLREHDDYHNAFFVYRPGGYLAYHIDTAIHDNKRKVITANLYFTEGDFIFQERAITVQPGTLVAFTNDDTSYHGVRQCTNERMLVSVGYIGPSRYGMTRANKRAIFVPWPNETWTPERIEQAKERSE